MSVFVSIVNILELSVFVGIVNMLDEFICRHCKYAG